MITEDEVCCKRMWVEIEDFRKAKEGGIEKKILNRLKKYGMSVSCIKYDAVYREYILLSGSPISYCPFCGAKLPDWLYPEDVICEEYGEDYVRLNNDPQYKQLPPEVRKEFDSDEWWKKRGL